MFEEMSESFRRDFVAVQTGILTRAITTALTSVNPHPARYRKAPVKTALPEEIPAKRRAISQANDAQWHAYLKRRAREEAEEQRYATTKRHADPPRQPISIREAFVWERPRARAQWMKRR